jgi:hypothetical protein
MPRLTVRTTLEGADSVFPSFDSSTTPSSGGSATAFPVFSLFSSPTPRWLSAHAAVGEAPACAAESMLTHLRPAMQPPPGFARFQLSADELASRLMALRAAGAAAEPPELHTTATSPAARELDVDKARAAAAAALLRPAPACR